MSRVAILAGARRKSPPTRNRNLRLESLERREMLAAYVFHVEAGGTFSANVGVGYFPDLYQISGTIASTSTVTLNNKVGASVYQNGTFDFKGSITLKYAGYALETTSYEIKGLASEDTALAATAKRFKLTANDIVAPSWAEEYLKLLGGSVVSTGTINNTHLTPTPQTANIVMSTLAPDSYYGYTISDPYAKFTMKD